MVCLLPAGGGKQVFQPRPLFIPFAQTQDDDEEEEGEGDGLRSTAITLTTITAPP